MNRPVPPAPTGRLRASVPVAPAVPVKVRALAELLGARVFVDVTVPRTTIRGRMRLVSRTEAAIINADARRHFVTDLGIEVDASTLLRPGVMDNWNAEVAIRHIAIAVRDPDDESKPLGDLVEWCECDDDQISALWLDYKNLASRLDPLSDAADGLTEDQLAELRTLLKKKGGTPSSLFESLKRSISELSSDDQPAT